MARPSHNELSHNRYYGKICVTHPELEGLRNNADKRCIQCQRDTARKFNKNKYDNNVEFRKQCHMTTNNHYHNNK